jgi:hypothetical protein
MEQMNYNISMNEKEYAEHLLRQMTIDLTMDFYYTKECALKCCEEMLILASDSQTSKFLSSVKSIIENK